MSKDDKRRLIKVLSGMFGLTIAATGLIFLWMGRDGIMDMMTEKKPAYSALEVDLNELHVGDHVTVDTAVAMDYVLQRTETGTSKGYISSQVTWRYYLIPVLREDGHRISLDHMVLVSTSENFKKIDEATDAFLNWWDSVDGMETFPSETVLSVDGRVAKLTNKELQFVKDYFGDEEYKNYVAPYVVKPLWESADKELALMGLEMGLVSLILGGILLLVALLYGRKKGAKENTVTGAAGQATQVAQTAGQASRVSAAARETAIADLRNNPKELKKYIEGEVKKLSAEQKAEVLSLIDSGQIIPAIKVFREMTGVGLAYAKEAIDHYKEYLK